MPRFASAHHNRIHIMREGCYQSDNGHCPTLCGTTIWPIDNQVEDMRQGRDIRQYCLDFVKEMDIDPELLAGICQSCRRIYRGGAR